MAQAREILRREGAAVEAEPHARGEVPADLRPGCRADNRADSQVLGDEASTVGRALLPFWTALQYLRVSFIAVALCALGAQVGLISYDGKRYPVKLSVALRLLGGPALGLALIYVMGLEGFLAQVLLISTTTPTAVNALLLSVEFRSNPDYTARAVLYSTLLSPITVTLGILLAQGDFLQRITHGFASSTYSRSGRVVGHSFRTASAAGRPAT